MLKSIDELISYINDNDECKFKIKVIANSKANSLDFCEEYVKVKITARAVEGKANKAIVEYFSKIFSISKSKISIVAGKKSSIKLIQVKN